MQQCATHVNHQAPDQRARVTHLCDNIECSDAELQAALSRVKTDTGGLRDDFERAVAVLLPTDPVARKRPTSGEKRRRADTSDTTADVSGASASDKVAHGPITGVELRFHQSNECKLLSPEEKSELKEWRETNAAKGKTKPGNARPKFGKKQQKKLMVAAIKKELKKMNKKDEITSNDEDVARQVISAIGAASGGTTPTSSSAASVTKKVTIKGIAGIIKKAKNGQN